MNVLTRARGLRLRLFLEAGLQLLIAIGLTIASLSVSSSDGALSLIVCLALAGAFGYLGFRSIRLRMSFRAQAAAEKVLRDLIPGFEEQGWVTARQRKLPANCRGYAVLYPPSGDLGFVIGLSGDWPDRGSLEDPQRVASELSSYGRPHVPVCLAAFVDGYGDSYPFGVLASSPSRLLDALVETEESYIAERAAALERIRIAHLPPEPIAGTVLIEEFAEPAAEPVEQAIPEEVI